MKRQLIAVLCTVWALCASAQLLEWQTAGNTSQDPDLDFLGNTDAVPMNIRTEDIRRFRLNFDETYTIGSYTSQAKFGSLLLSPKVDNFYTNGGPGPYSLLHLAAADDNASESSYRKWMDVGVTFTGNKDQGYIGHKYNETDYTDMVVNWSDNPGKWLSDRMRFIFTTELDAMAATGATSAEGLEGLRLFPLNNDEMNVGVGDFHAGSVNSPSTVSEPTERLDVLNGRVRIRQLPDDAGTEFDKVLVVDDANSSGSEYGVVKWRSASSIAGAGDCEWTMTGANDVFTAVGAPSSTCPDDDNNVGIGAPGSSLQAKLDVRRTTTNGSLNTLGSFYMDGTAPIKIGVESSAYGAGTLQFAMRGRARGADGESSSNTGVIGWASDQTTAATYRNVGVAGVALAGESGNAGNVNYNIGVEGYAQEYGAVGSPMAQHNYGGYFTGWGNATDTWAIVANGSGLASGGTWVTSDEALKTNIEPADANTVLAALDAVQLHTYEFNHTICPQLQLPVGPQLGVLATEFQAIFPGLVKQAHVPATTNAEGHEVLPGYDFKAVRMEGLIPYLIAGYHAQNARISQQNARIAEQDARLAEMQAALASCCATHGSGDQRMMIEDDGTITGEARSLRIVPNPFNEGTTLHYTLEKAGRMQLLANSADGKQLKVLHEAQQEAGTYQHAWSTAELSPGVYYVTLLLEGEPIVKKAVKVVR